jgi:hypothetical protein
LGEPLGKIARGTRHATRLLHATRESPSLWQ